MPDWLIQGLVVIIIWNVFRNKSTWKVLKPIIVWPVSCVVAVAAGIFVLLAVAMWGILILLMGILGRGEWLKSLAKPDKSNE